LELCLWRKDERRENAVGTLFSTLDLGRAGLQVAQVQLDITGHNIASVNKPGFTRQRAELTTRVPNYLPFGALGRGPAVEGVLRIREAFLDTVYRKQLDGLGFAEVRATYFTRMEDAFLEPGDNGFATRFNNFFDALNDFANNVESLPGREAVIAEGAALASSLNDLSRRIRDLQTNANEEVRNLVTEVNSLTRRIGAMNISIRDAELNGRTANDLRDDRDLLLDELAKLVEISYRERENGEIDVLLGGDPLVTGGRVRELSVVPVTTIDPERGDLLEVRFADRNDRANITGGTLAGVINMRDVELIALDDRIDQMAGALIQRLNQIHSQGNGLVGFSGSVTTTNPFLVPSFPLNDVGLPFPVEDGSFTMTVFDSGGNVVETITVNILTTDTFVNNTKPTNIEQALDGAANVSALISPDNRLTVTAAPGFSVVFGNDSSGVLAAMGLNTFFDGTDASSIRMNSNLVNDPRLLASASSTDPLETGDNTIALLMAGLRNVGILDNDSQTVNQFYQSTITRVGVNARANSDNLNVERAFVSDFEARRQEVSGVSIDEEASNLILYQRAFEASARVITVADRLLETLVNLGR